MVAYVAYVYIPSCKLFNVFSLNREGMTVKIVQCRSWKTSLLRLGLLEVHILNQISNCFLVYFLSSQFVLIFGSVVLWH